jgi:hypothetical protein
MSKSLIVAASLAALAFGSAGVASADEGDRHNRGDRARAEQSRNDDGDRHYGWRHNRHQRHFVWRHSHRRHWS